MRVQRLRNRLRKDYCPSLLYDVIRQAKSDLILATIINAPYQYPCLRYPGVLPCPLNVNYGLSQLNGNRLESEERGKVVEERTS